MCRHPHRKGDEIAQKVLSLYGVLDDPQWLARVDRAHLSDEQKKQLRDTVYETLIVLADFGPRWKKTAEVAEASLRHLQLAESFHEPTRALYWVRSECHRLLGDAAAAAADQQRFTETAAKTAFDYYLPGHSAGWAGDLQEAIRSYEAALAIQPDHFNSLFFLAWRLEDVGRVEESRGVARAIIAVKPDDQDALVSQAGRLLRDGKPAEAAARYRRAIELYPASQSAYYGLAEVLKQLRKDAEAREAFEKVVELSPDAIARHPYAPNANRFGRSLEVLGRWDEAIAAYRQAIELDPKNTTAHNNLGGILANQGQLDEAIACYRRAIELDPKNTTAHNNLAWYLATCPAEEMRDPATAIHHAQKAVELANGNAGFWNTLGVAQYRAGEYASAITTLEKSLNLGQGKDLACSELFLAMAQSHLDRRDEARKTYQQAIEWMDQHAADNAELLRFRQEAETLLDRGQ